MLSGDYSGAARKAVSREESCEAVRCVFIVTRGAKCYSEPFFSVHTVPGKCIPTIIFCCVISICGTADVLLNN